VVLLIFATASMHASVIYDFVGTGNAITLQNGVIPAESVAFQLTVQNFINPPLELPSQDFGAHFTCAQLDSSTNCGFVPPPGESVIFSNQEVNLGLGAVTSELQFNAVNGAAYTFDFSAGAFDTPGVYTAFAPNSGFNPGTLTVTVAMPEAGNATLLDYSLLLGVLIVLLRRTRSVVSAQAAGH
jgi:hypothetical protein